MHTPEQIRTALRHHNLSAVAKETGIPYMNVWRLVRGDPKRAGYETVRGLSEYLDNAASVVSNGNTTV